MLRYRLVKTESFIISSLSQHPSFSSLDKFDALVETRGELSYFEFVRFRKRGMNVYYRRAFQSTREESRSSKNLTGIYISKRFITHELRLILRLLLFIHPFNPLTTFMHNAMFDVSKFPFDLYEKKKSIETFSFDYQNFHVTQITSLTISNKSVHQFATVAF